MYSLGIILFELFSCFTTTMERSFAISRLRAAAATGDSNLVPKGSSSLILKVFRPHPGRGLALTVSSWTNFS
jgi:hypothetical protein